MDRIAHQFLLELERLAAPRKVIAHGEIWSWRVADEGSVWLQGGEHEPTMCVQPTGRAEIREPFTPDSEGISAAALEAVRLLS